MQIAGGRDDGMVGVTRGDDGHGRGGPQHVRTDILSTGRGKATQGAFDRHFCRDVAILHQKLGGEDVGKKAPVPALRAYSSMPVVPDMPAIADGDDDDRFSPCNEPIAEPTQLSQSEGGWVQTKPASGYVIMQSKMLKSAKAASAPGVSLTGEKRKAIVEKCQAEWKKVSFPLRFTCEITRQI